MGKINLGISSELATISLSLILLTMAPFASSQCPSDTGEWMLLKDSCYKFHNISEFWYPAEMTCRESNGHLVSIDSDHENRLVARLSMCRDVWIGIYGIELKKLSEPSAYEWSDEKTSHEYNMHKFTDNPPSVHQPLVRAANMQWHNSLYHEQHPFMCEVPATVEHRNRCPSTMKYFQGSCYLLASFETTFIEANFFCQNYSTQLTSILNEAELRFINALDLSEDTCQLETMWLGLIKLNPCFLESDSRQQCWEWTDFSGLYANLPPWAEGEPSVSGGDGKDNLGCALIRGNQLHGVPCSEKHKFACKVAADSLTQGSRAWQQLESPVKPGGAPPVNAQASSQPAENENKNEAARSEEGGASGGDATAPAPKEPEKKQRGLKEHGNKTVEGEDDINMNDLLALGDSSNKGGGGGSDRNSNPEERFQLPVNNLESLLPTK